VAYEDLAGRRGAQLRCAIAALLTSGATCGGNLSRSAAAAPVALKIHTAPPSRYLVNWDEVRAALRADSRTGVRALVEPQAGAGDERAVAAVLAQAGAALAVGRTRRRCS